jgi:hypothetical protein
MSAPSSFLTVDEKGNQHRIYLVPGRKIRTTTIHDGQETSVDGIPSLRHESGSPVNKLSDTEFLILRSNTKVKKI